MDPMAKLAVTIIAISVAVISSAPSAAAADSTPLPPYTNHTVGGPAGWFFDSTTNSSAANYSSWASKQSFFLGDFLIFNTNTNMTVIQTYNATTYGLCNTDDDNGSDTFVYTDNGNDGIGSPEVVPVPLTEVGEQYYFSDAMDGVQCVKGLRFQISVAQGRGLPPQLNQPPPPPYAIPSPPPETATPVTTNQGERFYNGCEKRKGMVGFLGFAFSGIVLGFFFV